MAEPVIYLRYIYIHIYIIFGAEFILTIDKTSERTIDIISGTSYLWYSIMSDNVLYQMCCP